MIDPRSRIELFTKRLHALCEEAEIPTFDHTEYVEQEAALVFLWTDPEFCIAASLPTASVYGFDAKTLRSAWEAKFGSDWAKQRAA
jgi:hypothetical protein